MIRAMRRRRFRKAKEHALLVALFWHKQGKTGMAKFYMDEAVMYEREQMEA